MILCFLKKERRVSVLFKPNNERVRSPREDTAEISTPL
uniref:Uncharacterized protein n=1 Tax=Anguilla anguilla TaxID=7936 RepID=A0A0E9WG24_ANGAN